MRRYYYVSDDLDDLELVEQELEKAGFSKPQIHVLSTRDAEVAAHHNIHYVDSVMKKDVVHGTETGAIVGAVGAAIVLVMAHYSGLVGTVTWVPFIFLSIVVFGFCTWEGGLLGMRETNHHFKRFEEALRQGKHIFFVDISPEQKALLSRVISTHPRLAEAGSGPAKPRVLVWGQQKWKAFIEAAP